MDASAPVQGVLLLDFVLIVSVISVAQMPETGSPPLDYHIQTTGRLLQQFDLIIPSSLKKVQPTDSPPVCRLGFIQKILYLKTIIYRTWAIPFSSQCKFKVLQSTILLKERLATMDKALTFAPCRHQHKTLHLRLLLMA